MHSIGQRTRKVGLPEVKTFHAMFTPLDSIHKCDRQTDGRTDIVP